MLPTLELEPPPAPEPSWPSPGAAENGLCEGRPHVLAFPPDLIAEQFTLMDAVSSQLCRAGRGGGLLWCLLFPGPGPMSWPKSQPHRDTPCDRGKLLNPKASTPLWTVEMRPPPCPPYRGTKD